MKSAKMILMDKRNDLMIVWWTKNKFYIETEKGVVHTKDILQIRSHVASLLISNDFFWIGYV